jgi:hypothetical protein
VKPGELERNLSRLVEVARTARERLAAIEREMTDLRHDLETLAARSPRGESRGLEAGELAADGRPDFDTAVPRPDGDLPGPEAGSE